MKPLNDRSVVGPMRGPFQGADNIFFGNFDATVFGQRLSDVELKAKIEAKRLHKLGRTKCLIRQSADYGRCEINIELWKSPLSNNFEIFYTPSVNSDCNNS